MPSRAARRSTEFSDCRNSVAPGIIDTDVNAGRLRGNPEAEAEVVAFLASDDTRWVTGKVIDATGGSGL